MIDNILRFSLSGEDFCQLCSGSCTTNDLWRMARDGLVKSKFSYALAKAGAILTGGKRAIMPTQIVQFWDSEVIPFDVAMAMVTWICGEPDFGYTRFSDFTARAFIAEHYERRYIEAYEYCHHPAMRSDYFRLAYLAQNGGIYIDADEARVGGLSPLVSHPPSLQLRLLVLNSGRMVPPRELVGTEFRQDIVYYLSNAFIACTPHHPFLQLTLDQATALILEAKRKNRRTNIHDTTGPTHITSCLVYFVLASVNYFDELPSIRVIVGWEKIAENKHLKYKNDDRNWRSDAVLPYRE